jgi:hypothetical protein
METHPTHAQDIEAKRDEISEAWVGLKDQVSVHLVITIALGSFYLPFLLVSKDFLTLTS